MIAFFFTMPMSRRMPMMAIMLKSISCPPMLVEILLAIISASTAPTPAEGRVEMMVIGMDVTFVKNAQHDIDGQQRGQNQPQARGERLLVGQQGAGKSWREWCWACWMSCSIWLISLTASLRAMPGARLKESVTEGNCP